MPGLGFRTALKILTIVGDGAAFPTAGHLAAYAGLAPVTRRSGCSIKGETRSQRGNHALKSALFLSAFASLADPTSRAYYDRKRAEGKRHNAALICLARRRVDVIYAMLRDRKPYQVPAPTSRIRPPPRLDKSIETPPPARSDAASLALHRPRALPHPHRHHDHHRRHAERCLTNIEASRVIFTPNAPVAVPSHLIKLERIRHELGEVRATAGLSKLRDQLTEVRNPPRLPGNALPG